MYATNVEAWTSTLELVVVPRTAVVPAVETSTTRSTQLAAPKQTAEAEEFHVTLPIPPSANHCHTRRSKIYYKNGQKKRRVMNVLTKAASDWMGDARDSCLQVLKENGWKVLDEKAVVEVWVWWPDRRRRDVHNLYKLLCDALEGFVAVDDKWFLVRSMDFRYDKQRPRVEVRAYPYDRGEP